MIEPSIKAFFKKRVSPYNIVVFPIAGIRKQVVEFTGAEKGAKILDVATGTGKQAFAFAGKGYSVTGIDSSEDMLKFARLHNKYENAQFMVGDAANLPFEENSFDVATISLALHEMSLAVRQKVVAEMARVTMNGGIITVVDFALPRGKMANKIVYTVIKSFESEYYPEFIKSDLPALLENAGIKIEAELSVLFGIGRIIKGTKAG
jgi:ubiquinone/menaquinone biosynthesis C-methylase UbiE